jgi:hypothetical protein
MSGDPSIHLAPVRVHPGIVRAGDAEDPCVNGTAVLLPHVELPAGTAQRLLAAVAIDDGRMLTTHPAGLIPVCQSHDLSAVFDCYCSGTSSLRPCGR